MYLPTTIEEIKQRGWDCCDVILISGDSYIDCPQIGVAVIGRLLEREGFRVGIIAQPDITSGADITRLGEPALFWGVSGGSVDSMVANYTALQKKRRRDDYTPGGINNRRPDRAVIVYSNLIRRYFKATKPIILGGIEASLRRVTHYDFWDDRLRAPILFDSKADFLLYGMAEQSILEFAHALQHGDNPRHIRGLCYLNKINIPEYLELPSFELCLEDKQKFVQMYKMFYENNDPITAKGLEQKKGDRWIILNPPQPILSQEKLEGIYALPFERNQHPYYEVQGPVKALETIRFSIATHRGCYGECNFCAIAVHEGRTVQWRGEASILEEASSMTKHQNWKGIISDVGGPTANMYAIECQKKLTRGACTYQRCIFPTICPLLKIDHHKQTELLKKIRKLPGVRKAFVASGLRYDMLLSDKKSGQHYLYELTMHHVSGQLKIAPEHSDPNILTKMGKPGTQSLMDFKTQFEKANNEAQKKQFLTYYFIAAYPGSTEKEMKELAIFATHKLNILPEQVQIFTPTPSTYASLMYYTETDPWTGDKLFVEKNLKNKARQKELLIPKSKSTLIKLGQNSK